MTIAERHKAFVAKYNGKKGVCTPSGAACGQCVGLFRRWVAAICGGNSKYGIPTVGFAEEIFGRADPKKWRKIKNTSTNYPRVGDIVVWNGPGGKAGHVASAMPGCTATKLDTFGQNFKAPRTCGVEHHGDYDNVIGWLRKIA